MRDLKFRLRDKDDKILGYEHQRDGRWFYTLKGVNHWFEGFKFLNQIKYRDQFIGLLDKNGKEIYEGDIIREGKIGEKIWGNVEITQECIGIVEYQSPNYDIKRIQVGIAKDKNGDHQFSENRYDGVYEGWSDCEVIGNIYENQELLK